MGSVEESSSGLRANLLLLRADIGMYIVHVKGQRVCLGVGGSSSQG